MDKQAAEVLGEPVMDGVILLPRGAAKKYRKTVAPAAIGGLAGSLARVAADRMTKDTSPVGDVRNTNDEGAFLALTASHLVLFETISGRLRQKLGAELARFSPGDLVSFEVGAAAAGVGTLDIVAANGDRWVYEFSKVVKRKIARLAEAAQAQVVDVD